MRRSLHLSSHYIPVLEYSTTTKPVFFLAAQIAMEDISRCFPVKSWLPSMPVVDNYDPIVCQISKAPCKAKSICWRKACNSSLIVSGCLPTCQGGKSPEAHCNGRWLCGTPPIPHSACSTWLLAAFSSHGKLT